MNHRLVDYVCDMVVEYAYTKYDLANHRRILENKEKLLSDVQYYPYFIRLHLGDEYIRLITQDKKIYSRIKEDAESSLQDKTNEFIEWIEDNDEYSDFINTTEKQKLEKEITEIEKERKYLYTKI